ncbi:MAG: DNA repair protein RecO [Candidatus Scalindua sp. AMX11]|nr:MAG: DNA repair protein RecO [Candidatus Scalindua sp.]NOG82447.1 DNA repair protein RecO [Planctomycetota bacterium]RZV93882.1 MAG: DNA repair protein RecO [Candidatus Scalindua sp. SCAELEC01]TDE65503.1 MAG: DNA repair protein RecO [Candidatus Scalindua sp. AMX11]GJQ58083.1 MAG: DNA repair protein RecO [Candidatus Scalindua sp.]
MGFYSTPAITLRKIDFGDSSQIITFFTRKYGKIQTLAKGLKLPVKGIGGGIDLFTQNQIVFIQQGRSHLHLLTEWMLQESFCSLRDNLRKFYSALYLLELVGEFTEINDKNESLYDLVTYTLREVAKGEDPTVTILAFEVQMLSLIGYMPEMHHCVFCKSEIDLTKFALFNASEGGLLCQDCGSSLKERIKIMGGTIATINCLAGNRVLRLDRLKIEPLIRNEIRKLLKYYFSSLLNKKLKMWKYL